MKSVIIVFLQVVFLFTTVSFHPIEKISVGNIKYSEKTLDIKIKILEEDLIRSLMSYKNRHIHFGMYRDTGFDKEILSVIESYTRENLEIFINGKKLNLTLKSVKFDPETMYSDESAIFMEVTADCEKSDKIKFLKIKNTLLLAHIYDQKNILHVAIGGEKQVLIFKKGEDIREVKY